MVDLTFLKDFEKSIEDIDGIGDSSESPRFWFSTGNYVLNKIISGKFNQGIPQGRITNLSGPSGSGKSLMAGNCGKNAQDEGAFLLVIDSENALDDHFMQAIGVDTKNNYKYVSVTTVPQVTKVVSSFLKKYREDYGNDENAPKILILIDSLDMLLTESEVEHFEAGEQKGDMGQRNKNLKQMLRTFVQAIKDLNVAIVMTSQVYKNQDVRNGEGLYLMADAVKYSASQIVLLTKLKLRDTGDTEVRGIRMKCEGYKTRFTKPFQTVTVEVPYDTGVDPLSGLVETATSMGIIEKRGNRYGFVGEEESWFSKDVAQYSNKILEIANKQKDAYLKFQEAANEVDDETETQKETKARRGKKVNG